MMGVLASQVVSVPSNRILPHNDGAVRRLSLLRMPLQ